MRLFPLLLLAACARSNPAVPAASDPAPTPAPNADKRVHLSFDDAPYMLVHGTPIETPIEQVQALNARILEALAAQRAPASVFFNCARLREGDGTVAAWAAAGHVVGNHTDTHLRLPQGDLSAWKGDVQRCHDRLARDLGAPPTAFRFPYLHAGRDAQTRDAALGFLASLGERRAPVTVATTEWMHGFAHRRANENPTLQGEIVEDLRKHLLLTTQYADRYAREVHSSPVPQILLLHVNEASAEVLPDTLADLAADGWTFVGLDEALAHPIYALPEATFAGGPSWLYRVNREQVAAADSWVFGEEEDRVVQRFGPPPTVGE